MTKYIRNNKTISGRLHDELVMMDIEKGKYFNLNPVATTIWEFLDVPRDIPEICSFLMESYEVDIEQCQREVTEHLDEMEKLGLILEEKSEHG